MAYHKLLAEWNRLNLPSNPHRYEDMIKLVDKAENTVGQLWVNRYPTMMEMSLLAADGTLDKITRIVQDVAETWETLRKCGVGRYIDAIEAYQHRCIDEAGQVCHLLLHPHYLPTRSTTITPSSLAEIDSSNEEQFNHRCAQCVRDIQVGAHHPERVPAPFIAHLPSVPRVSASSMTPLPCKSPVDTATPGLNRIPSAASPEVRARSHQKMTVTP